MAVTLAEFNTAVRSLLGVIQRAEAEFDKLSVEFALGGDENDDRRHQVNGEFSTPLSGPGGQLFYKALTGFTTGTPTMRRDDFGQLDPDVIVSIAVAIPVLYQQLLDFDGTPQLPSVTGADTTLTAFVDGL